MQITIKQENDEILVISLKHILHFMGNQIAPEAENCGQYLMKTVVRRENDEFLVITLKHVSGPAVVVNHPSTPKMWSLAH